MTRGARRGQYRAGLFDNDPSNPFGGPAEARFNPQLRRCPTCGAAIASMCTRANGRPRRTYCPARTKPEGTGQ